MAFRPPGPGGIGSHIHGPYRTTTTARKKAAASAAAAPSAAVDPGDPNAWVNSILNDSTYMSDLAGITADTAAARARRDAAVKALMFQYNDPSNPYSTAAQLARQEGTQMAEMTGDRAARGVLASGGTKLQAGDIGYNYGKSLYDALNAVTSQIGSLDQGVADQERSGVDAQRAALDAATQRLIDAGYAPSAVKAAVNSVTGGAGAGTVPTTRGVSTGSFDTNGRPVKLPTITQSPSQAPIPFDKWFAGLNGQQRNALASMGSSLAVGAPGVTNPGAFIPNPDRPGFSANGSPLKMTAWKANYNPALPGFVKLGAA